MLNGNNQERGGGQGGLLTLKSNIVLKAVSFFYLKSQSERRVLVLVQSRLHATTEVNRLFRSKFL